jgi:hypothetical protein
MEDGQWCLVSGAIQITQLLVPLIAMFGPQMLVGVEKSTCIHSSVTNVHIDHAF